MMRIKNRFLTVQEKKDILRFKKVNYQERMQRQMSFINSRLEIKKVIINKETES
jgi:hypothetical protein